MVLNIGAPSRYGPLQDGFSFTLEDGYRVLVGPNNSGKSSILQRAFVQAVSEIGPDQAAILMPDRLYVPPSTETGGQSLASYNSNFVATYGLTSTVYPYHGEHGTHQSQLPRLLLNHTDFVRQAQRLNDYLSFLGFPEMQLRASQQPTFVDVIAHFQGGGLRSAFGILAALTDPQLQLILIDEPEQSLEPKVQRPLRDLMMQEVEGKTILVATHSHLFLNRINMNANYVVQSSGGLVSVNAITGNEELYQVVFSLLGNDTTDLFFPGNYLVTEGASDQYLCEAALRLMEAPPGAVKVLAAGGATKVTATVHAVLDSLIPLIVNDSPYADRVVALIDQARSEHAGVVSGARERLKDRFFMLDQPSIEEYMPASLYDRAGRNKDEDLAQIERVKGNLNELRRIKRIVSEQLAAVLTNDDLEEIPTVRDAVRRALNP